MEELTIVINNLITNHIRLKGKFSGNQIQQEKVTSIEVQGNDEALMERIMKVVNKHLSNPELNVEMLSQEIGLSRTQLNRRMKEMTGLSPNVFIRNLRLRQAAELLKNKDLSVTQIAYSVGFNSQSHFSVAFRKFFGVSPVEYMQQTKERPSS